jgi:hypothetical protein
VPRLSSPSTAPLDLSSDRLAIHHQLKTGATGSRWQILAGSFYEQTNIGRIAAGRNPSLVQGLVG